MRLSFSTNGRRPSDAVCVRKVSSALAAMLLASCALVDQQALLQALDSGRLGAATLDVTDPEPLPAGHPLYTHPRVRLTPHISWAAGEVQAATADKFIAQLTRYLQGEPLADLVDARRGY